MNVKRLVPALALPALLLAACGDDDSVDADDLDGRAFVSTTVEGQTLVEGTDVTLAFEDDGLAAVVGCNTMRGGFEVDDGALVVGALAQTLMACPPDLQAQDEWVAAFLQSEPELGLDGDELVLTGTDVTITFVDRESTAAAAPLDETAWAIVSLDGADGSLAAPEGAYVEYADGTLAVFTGCNRGSAQAEAADGTVTVGPMALTMMACDGELGAWEAALLAFLDGTLQYERDDDTLVVTNGDQTLVLRPLG